MRTSGDNDLPSWDAEGGGDPEEDPGEELEAMIEHADRPFAAESFGGWGLGLCLFSLPLLQFAPLLGVNPLPASGAAGGLFLLSLILAVAVGLERVCAETEPTAARMATNTTSRRTRISQPPRTPQ